MAYNPECEPLNTYMHTSREYLHTLQDLTSLSLTPHNLWIFTQTKGQIWMCCCCKQFTRFIFQSCSRHCLITACPGRLWCALLEVILSPTQCHLAPIKTIISASPCPSTFPLHLVKTLNPRTWKRFTTYGSQGPQPNGLPTPVSVQSWHYPASTSILSFRSACWWEQTFQWRTNTVLLSLQWTWLWQKQAKSSTRPFQTNPH